MKKFLMNPEVQLFLAAVVALVVIKIVLYNVPDTEPLF